MNRSEFVISVAIAVFLSLVFQTSCSDPDEIPKPAETGSQQASGSGSAPAATGPYIWPEVREGEILRAASNLLATNYYVLLDRSGSMGDSDSTCTKGEKRMDLAKKAAIQFANNLSPDANLGLMVFGRIEEMVPLGTNNRYEFEAAVNSLSADSGTPLRRAMKQAYQAIERQAKLQGGYGIFLLIVLTDGESSDGNPADIARNIVNDSTIEVHVIGFCLGDHSLNIAGVTKYYTADSPEALQTALADVAETESEDFDTSSFN